MTITCFLTVAGRSHLAFVGVLESKQLDLRFPPDRKHKCWVLKSNIFFFKEKDPSIFVSADVIRLHHSMTFRVSQNPWRDVQ